MSTPPAVIYIVSFYPGASRTTGSPRRERTVRRRSPRTKGELVFMSFMSQALRAHSFLFFFSLWVSCTQDFKKLRTFVTLVRLIHLSNHLPLTHWPEGPRLASRFCSVMTGSWQRVQLHEMITQHRSTINSPYCVAAWVSLPYPMISPNDRPQ